MTSQFRFHDAGREFLPHIEARPHVRNLRWNAADLDSGMKQTEST